MKVYVVNAVDPCGYDSWEISYHLTRKGALKYIMNAKYSNWEKWRYITPGGYEDEHFFLSEHDLHN